MLAALGAGLLVLPFLALDVASHHNRILHFAAIHDRLARFAPHLNVNGVVDVVTVFIFAFLDASCKVDDHSSALEITGFGLGDDANDAVCVEAHDGQFNGVMLLDSSKARTWASG